MATTQYQVLYRYINEATNTAITNSMKNEYETVREIYVDANPGHKIFSKNPMTQAEAIVEQQEMISFGNSSGNPKADMLFAYDGTKKIKHKVWIEEATGYIVRDWTQIRRSNIGNQGDFTKEFTTLDAATPEDGGTVVCTLAVLRKYLGTNGILVVANDNSDADAGTTANPYYSVAKMNEMIYDSTMFKLISEDYQDFTVPSKSKNFAMSWQNSGTLYYGPVAIGGNAMQHLKGYNGTTGYGQFNSDSNLYASVTITPTHVETTMLPGHYEEAADAPYLIADTYKRIKLSPWCVHCTSSSLESAIEKAKTLVEVVGIENVKLIKVVPFDQFVKIK